ncbi:hypothetical protein ACFO4L_11860 [Bacillus daqingensis]|uniref:DUF3098 domain-containing protein n=1 Tax=Bacillus daqingensis TaxID=872396 RepID=A0ABV9NWP0_9BACI
MNKLTLFGKANAVFGALLLIVGFYAASAEFLGGTFSLTPLIYIALGAVLLINVFVFPAASLKDHT